MNTPHMDHHEHQANETISPPDINQRTKKKDDLSIPLAIVFAGVLIAGSIIYTNKTSLSTPPVDANGKITVTDEAKNEGAPISVDLLTIKADDHVMGNPNADVVLIEYSDTECPFCKRFHDTMLQIMNQYGKTGQIAWVYRHFPLDEIHSKSRKEGEALECANELGGNEAFWKYENKIFEITPTNNGLDPQMLPKIADMVGLNVAAFTTCYESGKYATRVNRDFESGANIGVHGTPFSIAWNRKTGKQAPIGGAYPIENVKAILQSVISSPSAK